jgi:regulator of protease activity HflC (stomatin/prohibitin superfamily)
MIMIGVAASIFLTVMFTVIALFLLLTQKRKGADGTTGNLRGPEDEVKDIWQSLGLVDDSPNLIRAKVAGNENTGPILEYFGNVRGKKVEPNGVVRPLHPNEDHYADETDIEALIRTTFGKRVYGLPIIRNIRPLTIDRVVVKDTERTLLDPAQELTASFVKRYGLYENFLRPTKHVNVDTKDGVRFTVTSYVVLDVVDAKPAFEIYPDSLLQTISKIVSGFISTKVIALNWDEYKAKGSNGQKFTQAELEELNLLLQPLGLIVKQFTMSDPVLNPQIQQAFERKATAVETAAAKREEGAGERDYRKSVAEGDAMGIERLAVAKRKRFEELVTLYKANGVTAPDAVDKANAMIAAEFNAEAIGKLTGTYVAGGVGVQFAITGEKK